MANKEYRDCVAGEPPTAPTPWAAYIMFWVCIVAGVTFEVYKALG